LTISVVTPCDNDEAFLAPAIESVIAGTRAPDKIIVVDDGSHDASAAVAARPPNATMPGYLQLARVDARLTMGSRRAA